MRCRKVNRLRKDFLKHIGWNIMVSLTFLDHAKLHTCNSGEAKSLDDDRAKAA